MLFPSNCEELLGFAGIREQLKSYCNTAMGVQEISDLSWINSEKKISQRYSEIDELLRLKPEGLPSITEISEVETTVTQIKVKGNTLSIEQMILLLRIATDFSNWSDFLKKHKEESLTLYRLTEAIDLPKILINSLEATFDGDGRIKDNASPELKKIRKAIAGAESKSRKFLEKIFQEYSEKGYVPEGTSLAVRNGRHVIPVRAEKKRQITGYFQGASSTGSIVYIEPDSVVDVSNEIFELNQAEQREIHRILTQISALLFQSRTEIEQAIISVGSIDAILAKVKLLELGSFVIPVVGKDTFLFNGFHPVLFESNKREKKKTVPLTLELTEKSRIIAISGPNAGGKSVALKTLGINQLMFQHGLPIAAQESSRMQLFDRVILDIGDNQSIENDLSTYSSHLLSMKKAVEVSDSKTLFLFDEFGSGTAPRIGGAISQAVIEKIASKGAFGILTTHYDNIKEVADTTEGMTNSTMRFDVENLQPLYEYDPGKPGSSFAIEMAEKTGLPSEILDRARELAGVDVIEMEKLLARIQKQKSELETREKEVKDLRNRLENERRKYESLSSKLDSKKDEILAKATAEADQLLKSANKEIEKTIRHIKTSRAHGEETKKVRSKIEKKRKQVEEISDKLKVKSPQESFKVGDRVKIKGQNSSGIVQTLSKKEAEVLSGSITLRVKLSLLTHVNESEDVKRHQWAVGKKGIDLTQRRASFSSELNLRGMRAEQAMVALEKFLDDALLLGSSELSILHGKGDGVLRQMVRDHLRKNNQVARYEDEHADRGGAGITKVYLK